MKEQITLTKKELESKYLNAVERAQEEYKEHTGDSSPMIILCSLPILHALVTELFKEDETVTE